MNFFPCIGGWVSNTSLNSSISSLFESASVDSSLICGARYNLPSSNGTMISCTSGKVYCSVLIRTMSRPFSAVMLRRELVIPSKTTISDGVCLLPNRNWALTYPRGVIFSPVAVVVFFIFSVGGLRSCSVKPSLVRSQGLIAVQSEPVSITNCTERSHTVFIFTSTLFAFACQRWKSLRLSSFHGFVTSLLVGFS